MLAKMSMCMCGPSLLPQLPTGNAVASIGAAFVSAALSTGSLSDRMAMRWTKDKEGFEMNSKLASSRHAV